MVNFGPLAAEIVSLVWGTPANFNGFCILPSSLLRCCSLDANHTLHDVWPYPALLHYIYILGALAPWQNFACCKIHFPSKSCSLILAPLLHGTPAAGVSQTLRRWTEGATYIRQGGHQVGHWPTFLVLCTKHDDWFYQMLISTNTAILETNIPIKILATSMPAAEGPLIILILINLNCESLLRNLTLFNLTLFW